MAVMDGFAYYDTSAGWVYGPVEESVQVRKQIKVREGVPTKAILPVALVIFRTSVSRDKLTSVRSDLDEYYSKCGSSIESYYAKTGECLLLMHFLVKMFCDPRL